MNCNPADRLKSAQSLNSEDVKRKGMTLGVFQLRWTKSLKEDRFQSRFFKASVNYYSSVGARLLRVIQKRQLTSARSSHEKKNKTVTS